MRFVRHKSLTAWGVPDKNVFFEAFGPATVKKKAAAPVPTAADIAGIEVTFSKSGKKHQWSGAGSLLDFAIEHGVKIDSGCRAGSCGSCLVAIKSGEVDYLSEPGEKPESGSCLTCICRPRSNLVLDA